MADLHRTGGLSGVFEGMDRMMEETFGSTLRRMGIVPLGEIFHGLGEMIPPVDLFEDGGTLVLRSELPGMKREEIDISITGNLLVISGEKKHEGSTERKGYLRRETSHGTFRRTVTLPESIDAEKTTATFRDGVLEIRMPRSGGAGSRHITIH